MLSRFFIHRPIFSSVISLLIFIAGLVAMFQLPVEQFPDIVPPSVSVTCSYPGADSQTLAQSVAIPIETQVNGVDGMIYMMSTCASDGTYSLQVFFRIGTDPDINTINVANRVKIAEPRLPAEVKQTGVVVKKRSSSILGFYSFQLDDAAAMVKDEIYLSNYVSIHIRDILSRVKGVGDATLMDAQDFSMRIWLNPKILSERHISINEIVSILSEQNRQIAAGSVGADPAPEGQLQTLIVTTAGRLQTPEEFENLVVRTSDDGKILRLKDIARIELAKQTYNRGSFNIELPEQKPGSPIAGNQTTGTGANIKPSATIAVYMTPGANAVQVARNIDQTLEEMTDELQRAGIEYTKVYDSTVFIDASMEEVRFTLILTVVIVVMVVYVFLQDWRAAMIPSLTIPVSLVGTFFMMSLFGFSINTLTMFGLCLVIGIVVDDAIVVVENCQRLLDSGVTNPVDAAIESMAEVTGPVIATTCVLMAVFLPTVFISGMVGILYQQFALTISGAVMISSVCALTIAPALCAILLRPGNHSTDNHEPGNHEPGNHEPGNHSTGNHSTGKFIGFRLFNWFFDGFAGMYNSTLKFFARHTWITVLFWIALTSAVVWAMQVMPHGFLPGEDQGALFIDLRLPDGRSLQQTNQLARQVSEIIVRDFPDVVSNVHFIIGYSMIDGTPSTNKALGVLTLRPWHQRPMKSQSASALVQPITQAINSQVLDARTMVFSPPPILGIGTTGGLEGQLIDKNETGMMTLYESAQTLNVEGIRSGVFALINSTFQPTSPQYYLDIDRQKAKKMGISLNELGITLQGYLGSKYVNDFDIYGRVFQVILQAEGSQRAVPDDILALPIMNSAGQRVLLSSIATVREIAGPQFINRYNLYTTTLLLGVLRPDESTGTGMSTMKGLVRTWLPEGFDVQWTGMAYQQSIAGSSISLIFVLSLVFGFLVLAAQYESWSAPLIIILAVPLGVSGAILAVYLGGLDINLYTQIGLILMVGLSAKNAILITEFARHQWKNGLPVVEAALKAGNLRLRPIMMTSYAFILGVVPLIFATGAGANSRTAIGTAVFGGMLEETMIGILVTPVLFIVITRTVEKIRTFLGYQPGKGI